MLVLTIRTDNPEAELGLFDGHTKLAYEVWHAHRELSVTIHQKIQALLNSQGKTMQDVQAIVCFEGPGSFTGLRIGLSVGNAVAYACDVPIVAAMGDDWIEKGINRLQAGDRDELALPHYGAAAHITIPRK